MAVLWKYPESRRTWWDSDGVKKHFRRLGVPLPTGVFVPRVSVSYLLRRRLIIALLLVFVTLSTFPSLWSSDLRPHLVSPASSFANITALFDSAPPSPVEEPPEDTDVLPLYLRPQTHLQGDRPTVHFRGMLHFAVLPENDIQGF